MVISGDGETFSHNLEGGTLAEQLGLINAFAETSREAQESSVLKDYQLSQSDKAELSGILANPASYKPKSPISSSALKAFEQYQQTQTDNARTISMVMSKLKAFSAYLTAEGKPLDYDTVADYLDTISDKRQTRQGHLWALRKFHKWATKTAGTYRDQFKGLASPYDDHEHARVGKAGGESWTPYTPAEVVQLHTAALSKNDQDLADLIKFACYTGCRIEEIGRIVSAP
ncbi:hypothetical protein [Pseudomonas anguilliseptica]|uniref:hypothetical protein n=1 Tax=Pseudomonas anguilliseptica TaxID=53406 RepID=UPI00325A68DF